MFIITAIVGGILGFGYIVFDSFTRLPELWWEAPIPIKVLTLIMAWAGWTTGEVKIEEF